MTTSGANGKRGEGQWALGYGEPLNKNEETKRDDDGLNVRRRIIEVYSRSGFDSIDPADLRGRFRWYGLYTQRRPGIDGGKTAVLAPEELDDRYFMLRVRIDGGRLSHDQLRTIAEVSRRYARGTADVTDRQNIQLHWVEIENVPAIWDALETAGLSTTEACGDTPRVILGCPLAGLDAGRSSTARRRSPPSPPGTSAIRRFPTCRASSSPRSAAARRSARCTRSTTSRSPAWSAPAGRPGMTCGRAGACRRTR